MASLPRARLQLLLLWLAGSIQAGVFTLVATHTVMNLQAGKYFAFHPTSIAILFGFACLPALLLVPLIACLAGSRRAWEVMLGAGLATVGILAVGSFTPDASPLSVFGVVAVASAFFLVSATRLFASALTQSKVRTTFAYVLSSFGLVLIVRLAFSMEFELRDASAAGGARLSKLACVPAIVALVLAGVARIRPADFVPLSQGIARPFIAGIRDAFHHRLARNSLVGLWVWFFVALSVAIVLIRPDASSDDPNAEKLVVGRTVNFFLGMLGGIVVAAINRHSFRCGWTIPYATMFIFVSLLCLYGSVSVETVSVLSAIGLGAMLPPMLHYLFTWTSPKFHAAATSLLMAGGCLAGLTLAILVLPLDEKSQPVASHTVLRLLVIVCGIGVLAAWIGFFRPTMEGTVELLLWPTYRIFAYGPDAKKLPIRGPYLVIGNHSAWLDPLYIAKIVPPPITPMMTSKFYDLPVISWLMRRVVGTIRVPEAPYRHEAPELLEAVAALDRGECVILFPEGFLRRKEEQPLRRFGRGIWKILTDRPQTPIFACWIEGNWGSYFSYKGGPPTKGKRIDFWTRLHIGVVGPITIDPAILGDHMAVRTFLMQRVADARGPLGLPPLELTALQSEGEKE